MRKAFLIVLGVATVVVAATVDASAAGRVSRFAALERLNNPFGTLSVSQLSSDRFGLPLFLQLEEEEAGLLPDTITPSATAGEETAVADLGDIEITPLSGTVVRPPYRPRVRSPFRPPPRPSLP